MREIKPENRLEPTEIKQADYPSFSIGLKHLPEAEKWKVGDDYKVSLKLRMKKLSKAEAQGEQSDGSVEFDIIGVETDREEQMKEIDKRKEEDSEGSYKQR